jgi:hypothetical protein
MPDTPREVIRTDKFRVVQDTGGNYAIEKYEGRAAMGEERWRDLKFGEADQTSRLLRDWIFCTRARLPVVPRRERCRKPLRCARASFSSRPT